MGRSPERTGEIDTRAAPGADDRPVRHTPPTSTRAFSLVELVIVIVIIGIIGAIAVPRMSSSAENAATNAVIGDLNTLQKAIDMYEAEHIGQLPGDGVADNKGLYFRLLGTTTLDGTPDADAIYGPYISAIPANKINGRAAIRIDGPPAGAGTHGWRYDSTTGAIEPDHNPGSTNFKDGAAIVQVGEKLEINTGAAQAGNLIND